MNKFLPSAIIGILFLVASYNVYEFFQEKQRIRLEQEAKIEEVRLQRLEEKHQAEIEHQIKLNQLALAKEKAEVELLEKKIAGQKRLEQYKSFKNAGKISRENRRMQLRIDDARELNNVEGLSSNTVQGIQQATYLTIRNNPDDYRGNYKPQGILRPAKLTQGGANGLMLFSMISTDTKAIKEIITIGHDVNTRNKSGYSALMFASAYNIDEVVSFLLEQGAEPKTTNYLTEGNALHLASRFNPKPEVVELLVKNGFNLEVKDKDGNTPLLVAVKYNKNIQVVEKLLELGANIKASDNTGNVAYSYAVERTQKRVPMGRFVRIDKDYENEVVERLRP